MSLSRRKKAVKKKREDEAESGQGRIGINGLVLSILHKMGGT